MIIKFANNPNDQITIKNFFSYGQIEYLNFNGGSNVNVSTLLSTIGLTDIDVSDNNDVVKPTDQYANPDSFPYIFNSGLGNDSIIAGYGNDTIHAGEGNDTINARLGNNLVYGEAGDDNIIASYQNDTIYGGTDNDLLSGSGGNDLYVFNRGDGQDNINDSYSSTNAGNDTISFQGVSVNDVYFLNNGIDITVGVNNSSDRVKLLNQNDSNQRIENFIFSDATLTYSNILTRLAIGGTEGNDSNLLGTNSSDKIFGLGGNDTITALDGNDSIYGGEGNDSILGGNGDDFINGESGIDTLIGGAGNDTYIVDNIADIITESLNEGIDIVNSSTSYTLSANVENLTLTGSSTINGTGNTLDNYIIGSSVNNTLTGGAGNDTLDGGVGADTLIGGAGNDIYVVDNTGDGDIVTESASSGTDTVNSSITYTLGNNLENLILTGSSAINGTGNTLNNVITGNSANNIINGGTGADTMIGGLGNDTYTVDNIGDVITENTGEGTDTVNSSITYTLGSNVENLTLSGSSATNGIGNELDNSITGNTGANILTGNAGNDTLKGGTGADTMIGGVGNDSYTVDNVGDVITEKAGEGTDLVNSSITYTLRSNVENLTLSGSSAINGKGNTLDNYLTGNTGVNILTGNDGNDTLDGGTAADTMIGGFDNDVYYVDNVGDIITENASEGTDAVNSSITCTLASNVENLTLTGSSAINGTGNILDNYIIGNAGANILNGGVGADTMIGGVGNDTYSVDNTGDVITENTGEGTDLVNSSINYTLGANLEKLTLTGTTAIYATGNELNNTITGNTADNIIDGGVGSDSMTGGAGNDTYYVDNTGDVVTESASSGTDTVNSSITYKLGSNLENMTLVGTSDLNGTGNTLNNIIMGNSGNNLLNGGTGADTLIGGIGNDTYVVDNTGDIVTENAGKGIDLIQSGVTYTLGANVENLTLTGSTAINGIGNELDNYLTGNAGANVLTGNSGNDTLDGGTGNDIMIGGIGNDSYFVNATGDVVTENAGEGTDTVNSSVTYTLGTNVENLTLIGTSAINGTGNTLDNIIIGNTANNTLTGAVGNDTYITGAGNDSITDASGNDTYLFNFGDNLDTITDSAGTDLIQLGNQVTKNNIAFFKDTTKFYIDYGNSAGVDKVTVNSWNTTANQIEKIQLNDGTFVTNTDINTIIQNMAAYATSHSISFSTVSDVKNNSDLMSLYMVNSWHS